MSEVAERIALSSDMTVPLKGTVLRSREINAFAMPGRFLFINTRLLEKAESELSSPASSPTNSPTRPHGTGPNC